MLSTDGRSLLFVVVSTGLVVFIDHHGCSRRRPATSSSVVGGEQHSSLAGDGGCFRSSMVVVGSLSVFADICHCLELAGVGAPRRQWAFLGCGRLVCGRLGVCRL